jgi:type II secretory pathway pseudopilin PulG
MTRCGQEYLTPNRSEPQRSRLHRCEHGYAMAVLLVAMSVTAVLLTAAMPVWKQMARREKEEELIFRGQQYARALRLFSTKYANASPPNIDVLVEQRFLRKKYKDPITNDDFQPVLAGQALPGTPTNPQRGGAPPQGSRGMGSAPGSPTAPGGGTNPFAVRDIGASTAGSQQGNTSPAQPGMSPAQPGMSPAQPGASPAQPGASPTGGRGVSPIGTPGAGTVGGIIGVVSKSKDKSLRLYNGRNHYNEWAFINTPQTQTPGAIAPGGPGQRGAPGQPASPFGTPGPFGGQRGRGTTPTGPGGRGFGPGTSPFGSPVQPVQPVQPGRGRSGS